MKKFNITGPCVPGEHYAVDISGKISQIMKLIDERCYFTVNRARQYGKTTTLFLLEQELLSPQYKDKYLVASITFQRLSNKHFSSEEVFCSTFIRQVARALKFTYGNQDYIEQWEKHDVSDFEMLGEHIYDLCSGRQIVLIIDEVDRTSSNQIFLQFLSTLRDNFIERSKGKYNTFHSVILAGVYDIKNIKLMMIRKGWYTPTETETDVNNSPWNIAVNFTVDMSFNPAEITTMLEAYEADHDTGMDITAISEEIYKYTSGYPFLVSRICQCIDESLDKDWTVNGVRKAVRILLDEKNTLFDDVFKNLENDKELNKFIYELLILGAFKPYVNYDPVVSTGDRYGFFKKQSNGSDRVAISNKIFELLMTDYYIAKDLRDKKQITGVLHTDVIKDGKFDMELCLRKFAEHYSELYNQKDLEFIERECRLLFLSYLKPLINGRGFYHIESEFTDLRRMDIVVDFGRDQFIIELKLWRGEQYEREAYEQLLGYIDSKKALTGYLLIFDFRKESNRQTKTEWIEIDGKRIFEVIA